MEKKRVKSWFKCTPDTLDYIQFRSAMQGMTQAEFLEELVKTHRESLIQEVE